MTQNSSTTGNMTAPDRTSVSKAALRACRLVQTKAAAALPWITAIALVVSLSFVAAASGFDPFGLVVTGVAQAKPQAPAAKPQTAPPAKPQAPQPLNPVGGQPGGPPITPKPGGPLTPYDSTYKIDAIEFLLTPDQFVEYKFRLRTGAVMIFNWKATAPVDVDFHTVPDGKPLSASETYLRGSYDKGQGTYRSPYPGLHGWYWHNTGKENVNIVLNASGFWTEARMFSGDPEGEEMELQDPAPPQ